MLQTASYMYLLKLRMFWGIFGKHWLRSFLLLFGDMDKFWRKFSGRCKIKHTKVNGYIRKCLDLPCATLQNTFALTETNKQKVTNNPKKQVLSNSFFF